MVPTSKLYAGGQLGNYPGVVQTESEVRQAETMLPGDMPDAIVYYSFPMAHAGKMVHIGTGINHAHQQFNKGYLLYSGTPEDGGLHDIPGLLENQLNSTMTLLPDVNLTIESATAHVHHHLATRAAACRATRGLCAQVPKLRCEGGPGTEFVAANDSAGIVGGYYDRMQTPTCDPSEWSYAQGDVFTIVTFLGRVHPDDTRLHLPFGMHSFTLGTFLVDGRVAEDRHDRTDYQPNLRYINLLGGEPDLVSDEYVDSIIPYSP